MRSIDLYTAIRAVDDDILERSEDAACERKKKSGWLKWGGGSGLFVCYNQPKCYYFASG